jgi:hypothetical protein
MATTGGARVSPSGTSRVPTHSRKSSDEKQTRTVSTRCFLYYPAESPICSHGLVPSTGYEVRHPRNHLPCKPSSCGRFHTDCAIPNSLSLISLSSPSDSSFAGCFRVIFVAQGVCYAPIPCALDCLDAGD